MSYETDEERKARYAAEDAAQAAKAQKLWDTKYFAKKPIPGSHREKIETGPDRTLYFLDWVKESNNEVRTKTTYFQFRDGKIWRCHSSTSKSQRFLVVSGPRAGERITDDWEDKEHVLFNIASSGRTKKLPRCVLVHVSSLKSP